MQTQISVFLLILIFVSVVSFTLAAYSNLRKTVPAARPFGMICVGIALFTLMYMFEVISIPMRSKIHFFGLKFIGVALISVSLIWFTFEYTGRKPNHWYRWLAGYAVFQSILLIGILTNPLHHWFFTRSHLIISYSFVLLSFEPRAGYYLILILPLLLTVLCVGVLIQYYFRTSYHRRQQVAIFLAGTGIPLLTSIYLMFGASPDQKIWMTSLAFATSVPILSLGVFRYRMLDVVPEVRTLILDAMDDAVIVINRNLRILDINPAAEKFLNIGLNDAIGAPLNLVFPEWESLGVRRDQEERVEIEIELTRGNNPRVFQLSTWLMTTWWGRSAGRLIQLRDITAERQMEQNLRLAKDIAEEAANAKSLFLANMSHEIRTPLNAVLGMSQLLLNTRLNAEQTEYTRVIHTAGSTLLNAINEILDYSKIEAGRVHLERQSFELYTCLEEATEMIAPQASARQLNLTYWLEDGVPSFVRGDAGRIRQVLVNLLANAVKFTEQGEVNLRVELTCCEDDQPKLHFMVRDTGIGIPPEKLPLLFELFSQVDAGISRRYGGTGLGLAICRRLVEQMGGQIWAESQPGAGSVFHFTLPLEAQPETAPHPALNQKRILILSPNFYTRTMLQQFATRLGMQVIPAEDNAPGLAALQTNQNVDVALIDQRMQGDKGTVSQEDNWEVLPDVGYPLLLLAPFGTQRSIPTHSRFAGIIHAPVKSIQFTETMQNLLIKGKDVKPRATARKKQPARIESNFASRYPMNILVADDNHLNRKVALLFLEQLGYSPLRAASGVEVIQVALQRPIDLLLLDIQMPEMDGLETARQIRSLLPQERQPRIVALTAFSFEQMNLNCLNAGMDDILNKPITLDQLRKVIEVTARKKGEATARDGGQKAEKAAFSIVLDELGEESEEMARLFLNEIVINLERLQRAWQAGNVESVGEIAHTLKSGCAYVGAKEAARLCLMVEKNASDGKLPETSVLSQIYTQIEEQFPDARKMLAGLA
ncbi:MAG: histidine kinase N-terminal 7TM domain-containing protein [Bellilinea sp.]|jgi:PAS domain S-box-containing protein